MQLDLIIEAILFSNAEPIELSKIATMLEITQFEVSSATQSLKEYYEKNDRGISLRFIGEKAQLCSNPIYAQNITKAFEQTQKKTFSQSVIETLSIIAYKQPVTRYEIEEIRGVRCEYSLSQLISQNFVEEAGRKTTIGRPIQYATTQKFLEHFNLCSIFELPRREEFLKKSLQEFDKLDTLEV